MEAEPSATQFCACDVEWQKSQWQAWSHDRLAVEVDISDSTKVRYSGIIIWGYIGVLDRDNGKENGHYCSIVGWFKLQGLGQLRQILPGTCTEKTGVLESDWEGSKLAVLASTGLLLRNLN